MFLLNGPLSTEVSCTISNVTGCKLYGTIFLSAGKTLVPNLTIKVVLGKTETVTFSTIPNMNHTRPLFLRMCTIKVPTTMIFWFLSRCSRDFLQMQSELSQSALGMWSRSRFSLPQMSETELTRRIGDVHSSTDMNTFYFLLLNKLTLPVSSKAQDLRMFLVLHFTCYFYIVTRLYSVLTSLFLDCTRSAALVPVSCCLGGNQFSTCYLSGRIRSSSSSWGGIWPSVFFILVGTRS